MTSPADAINGFFELFGAIMLSVNVWKILKDKQVKGVHWTPTLFFTLWGAWNCYFYPHLGQWLSFAGGCCIAVVNCVWLGLTLYYYRSSES